MIAAALAQAQGGAAAGVSFVGVGFAVWRLLLWLTARFDKRQAQLDAEHNAIDMNWKEYRLFIERDRLDLRATVGRIEKQNRALRMAFEHTAGALIRIDPDNPALAVVDKILGQAFPDDFTMATFRAEAAIERRGAGGAS